MYEFVSFMGENDEDNRKKNVFAILDKGFSFFFNTSYRD